MTVYKFKINYQDDEGIQERYVVAETEDEAMEKLEAYRDKMCEEGFAHFTIIDYPTVEIDRVIV